MKSVMASLQERLKDTAPDSPREGPQESVREDVRVGARAATATPFEAKIARFEADAPLALDAGVSLAPFEIAYNTSVWTQRDTGL